MRLSRRGLGGGAIDDHLLGACSSTGERGRPCLIPIDSLEESPAFGSTSETRCEDGDRRAAAGLDGSPVIGGGGRLGLDGGRAKSDVDMRGTVGSSTGATVGTATLSLTVPERVLLLRRPVGSDVPATGFQDRFGEPLASGGISSIFSTLLGVGTSVRLTEGDRSG